MRMYNLQTFYATEHFRGFIPMTLMDGAKWFISSSPLNLCAVRARKRDFLSANLLSFS